MELPKTASGRVMPARAREAALPSSVGTSRRVSVTMPAVMLDAGGEDAAGGDAEALDALFDDPVVGGADGPDLDVAAAEFVDEGEHLGEDVLLDAGLGRMTRRRRASPLRGGPGTSGPSGRRCRVRRCRRGGSPVFGVDPVGGVAGDEAGLDAPVHEAGAGVAGPEGAVAVEDGYCGGEVEDGLVEFGGGEDAREDLWHCGSAFLRGAFVSPRDDSSVICAYFT